MLTSRILFGSGEKSVTERPRCPRFQGVARLARNNLQAGGRVPEAVGAGRQELLNDVEGGTGVFLHRFPALRTSKWLRISPNDC